MDYIDKLQQSIHNIIQLEYTLNNYRPNDASDVKSEEINKQPTEVNYDLIKLNNQLTKMALKKEFRKKMSTDSNTTTSNGATNTIQQQQTSSLSINDDLYNKIDDDNQYDDWRQTAKENKMKLLDEYFEEQKTKNGIGISETMKKDIIAAVDENKILYKKDINFDKINKKIINLFGLVFIDGNYRFSVIPSKNKKKTLVHTIVKK